MKYFEILVKFKGRDELITYTMSIFYHLVTDKDVEYIINKRTGEIIYSREA